MGSNDKSQKDGKAVTKTEVTELGFRDYIAHIKKVIKAKRTLEALGGMQDAVQKCDAQIVATRAKIHKMIDADIDARLKED